MGEESPTDPPARVGWRRWSLPLALVGLLVLLAGATVVIPVVPELPDVMSDVRRRTAPAPADPLDMSMSLAFVCTTADHSFLNPGIVLGDTRTVDHIDSGCAYVLGDLTSRDPLTRQQRALGEWAAAPAIAAMRRLRQQGTCAGAPDPVGTMAGPCAYRPPAVMVDQVRRALIVGGFPDAVVRQAEPADPAPPGAVVYGVPLAGGACLVGSIPESSHQRLIVGRLPGGGCLSAS